MSTNNSLPSQWFNAQEIVDLMRPMVEEVVSSIVPKLLKEHTHLPEGKHCDCCSRIKNASRSSNRTDIGPKSTQEKDGNVFGFKKKLRIY